MSDRTTRAALCAALTAPLILMLLTPSSLKAQQPPGRPAQAQRPKEVQIGEEKLRAFAAAHVKISSARDERYNELGRTHEAQGKAQIRERLNQRIAQILQEHALTKEQYQRITFVISVDARQREAFEKIVAELTRGNK